MFLFLLLNSLGKQVDASAIVRRMSLGFGTRGERHTDSGSLKGRNLPEPEIWHVYTRDNWPEHTQHKKNIIFVIPKLVEREIDVYAH